MAGTQSVMLNLTLSIWRQAGPAQPGALKEYKLQVSSDASFLEMLDILNEQLVARGEEPVAFDYDCREGICGSCGMVINGIPHGPEPGITVCQLHMRHFSDGARIVIEPWRANAFPIIKDLAVDRSAFDRIIEAGGYVTVDTGSAPDANEIPIPKPLVDAAFDAAACIGCGACVAACKNASAALFVGAKITHLAMLPQGDAEREQRAINMIHESEARGFGACSNEGECEAVCPKSISTSVIARAIREYTLATLKSV